MPDQFTESKLDTEGKRLKITIECEGEKLREFETFTVVMMGMDEFNSPQFWRYFHNVGFACAYELLCLAKQALMFQVAEGCGIIRVVPEPGQPEGEHKSFKDLPPVLEHMIHEVLCEMMPQEKASMASALGLPYNPKGGDPLTGQEEPEKSAECPIEAMSEGDKEALLGDINKLLGLFDRGGEGEQSEGEKSE